MRDFILYKSKPPLITSVWGLTKQALRGSNWFPSFFKPLPILVVHHKTRNQGSKAMSAPTGTRSGLHLFLILF